MLLRERNTAQDKPNILVIMGDDVGYWNLSYNNDGMMGYKTPNIDRLAREGVRFTDYYAEQSCTAGRAAFITGSDACQHRYDQGGDSRSRSGNSERGPNSGNTAQTARLRDGAVWKESLGDRDEFLPTAHGFDEFYGNLYHLNAEEAPEHPNYPKDPEFRKKFGPRGVIRSSADGKIEDTGPLTKKRMETIDEEFLESAVDFIDRQHKADKPFFCWFNSTRMHYVTHVPDKYDGKSGLNFYADGMLQHDDHVGTSAEESSMISVSRITPSLFTALIMARTSTCGQMVASRLSEARRTPTGKAVIASRQSSAGRKKFQLERLSTELPRTPTGYPR